MSTSNSELVKEEEEESANEVEICELAKPRKCPKQSHKKREPSKYESMKVYPTSNRASRERLKRKIIESKENSPIIIRWDKILC